MVLYILDAWSLFEEIFAQKAGAWECINVGLDNLCINGPLGHDLVVGSAVMGSDEPNDIKGLFQST